MRIARVPLPTAPRRCCNALQEFHCPLPPGIEAMCCTSCIAHCPQAVRQCIAGVALPSAPRRSGSAWHEYHCPLPSTSDTLHGRSCTVHCPGSVVVHCRNCAPKAATASMAGHTVPQLEGPHVAGLPLPSAPRRCGSAVHEFHCPLTPRSKVVLCRSSTTHCPQAVTQCSAGVALSTSPRQGGSVLQEFHCLLPSGSEALYCTSSTA